MDALRGAYLYAAPFAKMNDPMEAFYKTGASDDRFINSILASAGKSVEAMYEMLSDTIDSFALVSLAGTYLDLPMWAYYASNFAGMCLEFSTSELDIGDFQNEQLRKVTYAQNALPSLTVADMTRDRLQEAVIARFTRKRREWAHEKEWRFITGALGRKHYVDDALSRVFLGPCINPAHAKQICDLLDHRPIEVLQGEIHGFELAFNIIKPARPLEECERVGAGRFVPANIISDPAELESFLAVSLEALVDQCTEIARRPNVEKIEDVDVSNAHKELLYIWTTFKLRNGREVYHKRYLDRRLRTARSP
ncbi:hypothetical protein OA90_13985 [Labrenzia sp. OB1]|nr:hypothetical protein OA90_13985 [Labrenzia sp. OB1]